MPQPDIELLFDRQNMLVYDKMNYDGEALAAEHLKLMSAMTDEQRKIYDEIMSRVIENQGGLFFLYGYGGRGKTFIWKES